VTWSPVGIDVPPSFGTYVDNLRQTVRFSKVESLRESGTRSPETGVSTT